MDQRRVDVAEVAPSSLKHIVGQQSVVAQVEVALEAAFADNNRFENALLVGPPGTGKTTVAQVIAREMASELHEVLGQSISSPADLNGLLLRAQDKDVVHIDESHELDKQYQTALYLALDQRRLIIPTGRSGSAPQSIPLAGFSVLLSSTDEYSLLQPLRDRMRLLLRFSFNSEEELIEIIRRRCVALGWPVDAGVVEEIAQRSRGTPRLALRLLQACWRVCRAEGATTISTNHLVRACVLEGCDELGLGPVEQEYLRLLADGASRLNVLASGLGLPTRTVSEIVEPFLIRAGLIVKDDQGRRQLTAKGREHMSRNRSER